MKKYHTGGYAENTYHSMATLSTPLSSPECAWKADRTHHIISCTDGRISSSFPIGSIGPGRWIVAYLVTILLSTYLMFIKTHHVALTYCYIHVHTLHIRRPGDSPSTVQIPSTHNPYCNSTILSKTVTAAAVSTTLPSTIQSTSMVSTTQLIFYWATHCTTHRTISISQLWYPILRLLVVVVMTITTPLTLVTTTNATTTMSFHYQSVPNANDTTKQERIAASNTCTRMSPGQTAISASPLMNHVSVPMERTLFEMTKSCMR